METTDKTMATAPEITWEPCLGGYSGFLGDRKVAILGTCHDQGLVRNGQIIYEPMSRETWGLHLTTPAMSVALLEVILASLPTEAIPAVVST